MLTTHDVAIRLGITEQHARKLCRDGALPAQRFGHAWMVDPKDLAAYDAPKRGRPPLRAHDDGL